MTGETGITGATGAKGDRGRAGASGGQVSYTSESKYVSFSVCLDTSS